MEQRPKTIFCDIDGVLCQYSLGVICGEAPMVLTPHARQKLSEWRAKGYQIVLTTGRFASRERTIEQLKWVGVDYDYLITGLGGGKRVIINDIKPDGTLTAAAYNLERNQGISLIDE